MEKHSLTFKVSAAQEVKEAFKAIRDRLTNQNLISLEQFIEYVQAHEDEYNCAEGYNHIRNAFYLRTADYKLTRMLEQYMIDNEPKS